MENLPPTCDACGREMVVRGLWPPVYEVSPPLMIQVWVCPANCPGEKRTEAGTVRPDPLKRRRDG